MGYQVLARKYRPQRFADVAGQDHVTRTLLNALAQNRIAHGYIFSGHRGIGKTTIARILAQALNCRTAIGSPERPTPEPCGICESCTEIRQGNAVDVIEIDAATNRGIDEIRELRDAARYAPARDRYKVYILDEAHQITEAAFNALLKTLEEPPAHVIFMMATTEPENIPQTIRSRCQHFSFHAVKFDDILAQLRMIAVQEQVEAEDAALALLAEAGDGSMRDALSIMDQAIASAPCDDAGKPVLAATQIRELMGSVPNAVFERLLEAVAAAQPAELMEQLNVLLNAGHSPSSLARQMVRYLRNALMAKLGGEQTELLQISADERARAARTALLFTEEDLTRNLQIVLRTFDDLNYRQEQRFHLELGLLKLIHAQRLLPLEELLSGVASGTVRSSAPAPASRPSAAPAPASRPAGFAPSTPAPPPANSAPSGSAPSAPAPKPASAPSAPISPFASIPGFSTPPVIKQSAAAAPVAEMPRAAERIPERIPERTPEQIPERMPNRVPERSIAPARQEEAVSTHQAVAVAEPEPRAAQPASPFAPTAVPLTNGFASTLTEGTLAKAPEPLPEPLPAPAAVSAPAPAAVSAPAPAPTSAGEVDVDTLRGAVAAALTAGGHASTGQLLAGANWIPDVGNLRIEVPGMGKKMLGLAVNAAAEKIIRQELQKLGGPARFMVVPGDGPAGGAPAKLAPLSGSIEEEAMKNPLVQKAREIFQAEVRSVVDLRIK